MSLIYRLALEKYNLKNNMSTSSQCEGRCSDGSRCKRLSGASPRCYQHRQSRGSTESGSDSPIYGSPTILGGFSPKYRGESPPIRDWESPEVYFRPRVSPPSVPISPATPPTKYGGYGAAAQGTPEGGERESPPGYSVRKISPPKAKKAKKAKARRAGTAKRTKAKSKAKAKRRSA